MPLIISTDSSGWALASRMSLISLMRLVGPTLSASCLACSGLSTLRTMTLDSGTFRGERESGRLTSTVTGGREW